MKNNIKRALTLILSAACLLTGCSSNQPQVDIPQSDYVSTPFASENAADVTESIHTTVDTAQAESNSSSSSENSTTANNLDNISQDNNSQSPTHTAAQQKPSSTQKPSQTQQKPTAPTQPVITTTAKKPSNPPSNPSGNFEASWKTGNTWEEGGKKCGTCELTVTNKSGGNLSSWNISFTVPNGFAITSSWSGIFSVSGTTVNVKNESYNGNFANGTSITIGFNYSCSSAFTPPSNITINGKSAGSGGGGNEGGNNPPVTTAQNPVNPLPAPVSNGLVKDHGKLSVKGTQLVDKNGKNFQLKGMSTHGIAWFPDFINKDAFKTLRDDWNTNVIRLAMYTHEYGGYCSGGDKNYLKSLIDKGVQAATDLGMYVIIDWHVLQEQSPQVYKNEAKAFFTEISAKYKNYENVLYEICNEPNGSISWNSDVKSYAEEIIPIIRKNSPDSVIIVGTPTWSQDIDKAAADPIKEKNVMYALHFYAATHKEWLRQRVTDCYNKGLPIFVTEFGCCDASGNGANDFSQTKEWLSLLDSYGISYCNWNLANKDEASSAFKSSASANGNWKESDMSESGKWIRKWFRGEN